ncbi:MFS transporter [Frondihabitans australicus]|uniref:Putative MFS family arabinose efflux permease n=1 Tax=Frondihabitans australicus TaxID=386892 RepID=A0A495IK33_9MICO|nr:MFS transporter [Frondihabitans australicus]RKR76327.1 putative MFS family arabinose efflux permease [Frondihabitans australicus]
MTTSTTNRSVIRAVPAAWHGIGFWIIAVVFTTVMAYSTVPTPLYVLYEARDGFPSFAVTFIFAAYAVGVVASLYFAGHISDWVGRRRIILISVAVEILASCLFIAWPDLPGLLVARFVNGVGVGMLTATATAHLSELRVISRSDGSADASTVSGVANLGGLGLGPLIGGLFAEFLPQPLLVPHVVFLALFVVAVIGVALVPETVVKEEIRPAYRPQKVSVPRESRAVFFAAGAAAFSSFAVFGLFTSLAPTFLVVTLHETDRLVAGAVSFSVFAAACLGQVLLSKARIRTQLNVLLALLPVGLVGLAVGAAAASLPVFAASGVVAGAGVGLLFRAALSTGASLAGAESKGEVLAALFLIAYAGLCIPVLLVGGALVIASPLAVLLVFVVLVLTAVLVSAINMRRRH